ncbi:MAG TPA: hypothetical protein GX497_01830 [Bacillus bacterium]|nr:hypothetical protein [Bacillus sp. (in: firmicutes)]
MKDYIQQLENCIEKTKKVIGRNEVTAEFGAFNDTKYYAKGLVIACKYHLRDLEELLKLAKEVVHFWATPISSKII